jgi:pimeloyl-ACP methyl ester carboxylesterase
VFAHTLWASRGAELLEKIGPAIVQVHSAGGPFSWIVANERPNLVKAIINVEGGGQPFAAGTPWRLTDVTLVYDPPVADPVWRGVTPGTNGRTSRCGRPGPEAQISRHPDRVCRAEIRTKRRAGDPSGSRPDATRS